MSLPITNIVTIQVSRSPVGLANYRVNNLLILTKESPVDASFGEYGVYKTPRDVATDWGTGSEVYDMAVAIFSQQPNILSGDGSLIIAQFDDGSPVETLQEAILRLEEAVYFGGVLWAGYAPTDDEIIDAAETCESDSKLFFVSDYLAASMDSGGLFYRIKAETLTYSRRFLYTTSAAAARVAMAAYAGRAMSVNFSGSNTTLNMQLKDLIGIESDEGITQTIYNTAEASGVDLYTTFGGVPCVISNSGGLGYFDQVYNLNWLKFALEVAMFNALRQTSTKIPQTEPGIAVLKNAAINVLNQAVNNAYLAPGVWNSPDRFGDPADLIRSVLENGWFVYTQPVNEQSQEDREARKAPLMQIACKEAGGVNTANVLIYVNA